MKYRLSEHAREEAERREIPLFVIDDIMGSPQQIISTTQAKRVVYQSIVMMQEKEYLVRVVVQQMSPLTVVTVYRTTNIKKYWSNEP